MILPIERNKTPEPETALHYWHPNRWGVKKAPEEFANRLRAIHPDLEVTWHPVLERWLVWYKQPRVRHEMCSGWLMLFPCETSWGDYVPLDERVLAAVYQVSARAMGNAVEYFDRIQAEAARDKRLRDQDLDGRARDIAGDHYDYRQIKNIGHGSKFQRHHS